MLFSPSSCILLLPSSNRSNVYVIKKNVEVSWNQNRPQLNLIDTQRIGQITSPDVINSITTHRKFSQFLESGHKNQFWRNVYRSTTYCIDLESISHISSTLLSEMVVSEIELDQGL